MYSELYLNDTNTHRSIPKIFVVAVIAIVGVISAQVYTWYASVPSKATNVSLVRHLAVNRTDKSVGIFFESSEKVEAYAVYGKDPENLDQTAYKDADSPSRLSPSRYHLITISDLASGTEYHFKLITEGRVMTEGGEDTFRFSTLFPDSTSVESRQPIYGKVLSPNGSGLSSAIILVTIEQAGVTNTYASVSRPSGEWLVPLASGLTDTDPISILVLHEDSPSSKITTIFAKAAPVPQSTVIGTDYSFAPDARNILPATSHRSNEPTFPISLLYPEKDAIIPNTRPLFKGFGIPGTKATVRVNSKPVFEAQSTISAQGIWVVEAERPFVPGPYTVLVEVVDNLGKMRTISRAFSIAKSGEQVLGETQVATPSGSIAPTRPLSATPSPSQPTVVTATPAPTSVIYITATPFLTSPTITPGVLKDAGGAIPLSWVIMGSILLSTGVILIRINASWGMK